jgi:hypothetical protein
MSNYEQVDKNHYSKALALSNAINKQCVIINSHFSSGMYEGIAYLNNFVNSSSSFFTYAHRQVLFDPLSPAATPVSYPLLCYYSGEGPVAA